MPIRVLFVDDEVQVLDGLKRMLHALRAELELSFAGSGAEALAILERKPHDVVVSDIRMPNMDGLQLLHEVRHRYPETVRIILSGHSDQTMLGQSIGFAHQYLTKPCEPAVLRSMIRRATALQGLVKDPRVRAAVSTLDALPSAPRILHELIAELQNPYCSAARVGQIVAGDVGMTAQVLRLVNSPFFGLRHEISSPTAAVIYLGVNTISSLVVSSHFFRQVSPETGAACGFDWLWRHDLSTGVLAKSIAELETNDRWMIDDTFAAGMLHDAGRILLAIQLGARYAAITERAREEGRCLHEIEQEELGVTNAKIGAYLMGIWGLPSQVVEAIAYHHIPSDLAHDEFHALTAVHVACSLDRGFRPGRDALASEGIDEGYLKGIGRDGRLPLWREVCTSQLEVGYEEAA
jgi:HD-like signal output (HDOD) protein/CheY-like chemotaxis protein